MGLRLKLSGWINACVISIRFLVLVNGSPEGIFGSSWGLRQGELLSPLLFLLIMEVLNRILKKTKECGLIHGFHVGLMNSIVVRIFHLLFTNDTILFCNASREQLLSMRLASSCFQAFTGLKVNVGKSEIVPIREGNNLDALANILSCRVGNLPMKYLGMPLGTSFKTTSIWNPILEKVEKKLLAWKRLYLSKGVRLNLLKSTLSSFPTSFLSLFIVPKVVATRLERI